MLALAPLLLLTALAAVPPRGTQEPAPAAPNVLVLLVDDLGLELLRIYEAENLYPVGSGERVPLLYPRTPNIDRLAREGVRFTQLRVPPTCSATRASLLTGRYPFRHGIGGIIRRSDCTELYGSARTIELGVGAENPEWTLAHLARAAGHGSFMAGKWHVALDNKHPALDGIPGSGWKHIREVAGFDEYWAIWSNLSSWPKVSPWTSPAGEQHRAGYFNFLANDNGQRDRVHGEYVTTVQVDRVLRYVDARGAQPWLVYCAFNAVHAPYLPPPPHLVATEAFAEQGAPLSAAASDSDEAPPEGRTGWYRYLAMVEALDHELGRLLDGLREREQLDQTVVLLLADNGTPGVIIERGVKSGILDAETGLPQLLRSGSGRFKHHVWEPGVRVPLIVRGPVVASPGRVSHVLVDAPDVFETVREILGVQRSEVGIPEEHTLDGMSFLDTLQASDALQEGAREFSFVEHFEPNGNPELVVYKPDEMDSRYTLRRGLVLETAEGRFKLLRNFDESGDPADQLFQLSDATGAPVDPWERQPLATGAGETHCATLAALQARLTLLLKTERRNWP